MIDFELEPIQFQNMEEIEREMLSVHGLSKVTLSASHALLECIVIPFAYGSLPWLIVAGRN